MYMYVLKCAYTCSDRHVSVLTYQVCRMYVLTFTCTCMHVRDANIITRYIEKKVSL